MVLTGWRLSVTTTTSAAKVAGLKTARAVGSATARPRVRQPGANLEEMLACRVPLKLIRAVVKREAEAAPTTMRIAHCPHTCLSRAHEKAEAEASAWISKPMPSL
ncbi:hypothetical protein VM57_06910 [Stenotrophomonas maltophilia]|uniref:Uncharacterized protein n=1 Tax=Stenotrophomonas maltophilia TaxID=40324 RepID=A0A0F5ZR32_STEMA|nr:hypothetical protein VM57_06910 [Stenotrophomonas maltophilia]